MRELTFFVFALFAGWLLAVFLTWLGWSTQIEGRAFLCTDDTYPIVWWGEDLDTHRRAGDTLGAGWSWEKIRRAQGLYRAIYYLLWLTGVAGTYWLVIRKKTKLGAESAAPSGGLAGRSGNRGAVR